MTRLPAMTSIGALAAVFIALPAAAQITEGPQTNSEISQEPSPAAQHRLGTRPLQLIHLHATMTQIPANVFVCANMARNLFNKNCYTSLAVAGFNAGQINGFLGEPRVIGLTLRARY